MSSHHIVRDNQEPALLIADTSSIKLEFIDLLLEWSPVVMVMSDCVDQVIDWGIKINIVIAHASEVEALKPKLKPQSPVQLLVFEETNLLPSAFIALVDLGHKAVNVIADIYQTQVLDLTRQYAKDLEAVVLSHDQRWLYIKKGLFKKWVNVGDEYGVHPLNQETHFTVEGFYQQLNNELYLEPFQLTSEVQGQVKIETNQQAFWLIEPMKTDVYS